MKPRIMPVLACWFVSLLPLLGASEYYESPQVYGLRPDPQQEWNLGPIGPSGIQARIYKGMRVTVDIVEPGTPAAGKFNKGDILLGVNGVRHKGKNPLVVFGTAVTEAEATDGVLTFDVQQTGSEEPKQVTVKIPVLGAYSNTYPLGCKKSQGIVKKAAQYYACQDRLKSHDLWNGLACLFLLSTGDDQYLPRVKEYFSQFVNVKGEITNLDDHQKTHTWFNGYNGIACGEYYLRTGDRSVLPLLQHYCDDARERQKFGLGWGHWGYDVFPSYESGGGVMHGAGNQVLTTLLLGKLCGVQVDDPTLLGALRHWYRFAGHGAVPASDQRPYHIMRSAGRDGATAALMHIASMAEGDTTIYKQAKEYLALSALTSWPERTWDWELYWHNLGGQFARETRPDIYNQTMQRFRWRYDLGRSSSGAFYWPERSATQDFTASGINLALAYTAPLKTLQITGAPKSKYAKRFSLPEQLWGTRADQAFFSTMHHPDYDKYGEEDEIHVPYWQLRTMQLFYHSGDVKDVPLPVLQKNVRHWRYVIREAAAKALCFNGHYVEIERLLVDKDPRLRRAGLDGINDCRHWFLDSLVGRNALKAEQYTPDMIKAIEVMMADPDEAWYVIDAALNALGHAPVEVIQRNIPRIMPWLKSDEWWLRHSAFNALMGLERDEELFVANLPLLIDTMVKEYHYNPRHQMVQSLNQALAARDNLSTAGQTIIAGFARAALESEVKPDRGRYPRSDEGVINIVEVALASFQQAPEASAPLAEALAGSGQLARMNTGSLMKLVKDKDGHLSDRFVGLYPSLQTLPAPDSKRVRNVLYQSFRPELMKRGREAESPDAELLDMLVDLTRLETDIAGWQIIGEPSPTNRLWRYLSFDPLKESEKLHPRIGQPDRLREVTLPEGCDGWVTPGFDAGKWQQGKAPIGVGVFKAHGHGIGWTYRPDFSYPNHSDWGRKEFILMRTTFGVENPEFDLYRVRILADQAYHIYLNGHKIHTYVWAQHYPMYAKIMLTDEVRKYLRKGSNTLAAMGVVRFEKDQNSDEYHHVGQMDLWIEGLEKAEIGL